MRIMLFILAAILYVIIGIFVSGIIYTESDVDGFIIVSLMAWPVVVVICLLVLLCSRGVRFIYQLGVKLGEKLEEL